ncbi:hypothetical protein FisN_4Hh389 [Fistulifera solaris]|uniref:Redoxin domain-containing protein n=1 Tax=Fistulifera solaris TaxID=1519565 RepID=A0A1Z5KQ34_FISSO|nr:hypothetical protein FisN_4Hh389 [Fistulifera solaris]|eukprot:GAX28420.1 hypothetical protein FisN_4Hh389 [Fistulifera solaris]
MKLFKASVLLSAVAHAAAFTSRSAFGVRSMSALGIAVGDKIPDVGLMKGFPDVKTTMQVPGYLEKADALKSAGIDGVLVYCVNDPAVMQAWSENQGVKGDFVTLMGDPSGAFTKALDLEMTHPGPVSVGIIGRSKRFALIVKDGTVTHVAVSEAEGDPAGDSDPSASLAEAMLEAIEKGALSK